MEVDAARRLDNALHLEQSHRHHDQIRLHSVAVAVLARVDDLVQRQIGISDLVVPSLVHVRQVPSILERRTSRLATNRCRVVAIRVERRIEIDQIDARVVDPPHHIEIVPLENRAVRDVAGTRLCRLRRRSHNLSVRPQPPSFRACHLSFRAKRGIPLRKAQGG